MIVNEHRVAVGESRLVGGHADSEAIDWILRKEKRVWLIECRRVGERSVHCEKHKSMKKRRSTVTVKMNCIHV